MSGPFDFLHIKGRTAGSSNELSFDVLDAARKDLDEKRKANRSSLMPAGIRSSQGNYNGVAGTSTLSSVPEVERRKRARRARAIRVRVIAAVVIMALLCVGAYAGFRFYEDKVGYTNRFAALVSRFVEIDKSMVAVDSLMADSLNSVERETRDQALAGFDELDAQLGAISDDAREMAEGSTGESDGAALAEVERAATARRQMLAVAADAFKLSHIANRQISEANESWSKVLAGDAMAREAASIANSASTGEATEKARAKTQEAIEMMDVARSQLSVIEQGIEGLDFSAERAYIGKRVESLEAAIETSDALLAGNRSVAVAANNSYNALDQEAADMARELPVSVADQVKRLYADEIAQKKEAYMSARSSAISADSALRSYLPR